MLTSSSSRPKFLNTIDEFLELNEKRTFRQKIHSIMFLDQYSGRLHHIFDVAMMAVIFIAVFIVICESIETVRNKNLFLFKIAELFISSIFIAEYVCRIFSVVEEKKYSHPTTGRIKYALTAGALIDFLAILPVLLAPVWGAGIEFLWVLRLLQIFKLSRYSRALLIIFSVLKEERFALAGAFFIFSNLIIISACLIYAFEHDAQPEKFYNIPMAIYWAVVTLTSIGYGDIYPITAIGQFFTTILAVIGIGMVALPTGIIANGFVEKLHAQKRDLTKFMAVRTNDSVISKSEQREIDNQINLSGMTPERGRLIEGEIFDQLGVIETHHTDDGLRLVFRTPNDRDKLTSWISRLSRQEKIAILTLLTASLNQDAADY